MPPGRQDTQCTYKAHDCLPCIPQVLHRYLTSLPSTASGPPLVGLSSFLILQAQVLRHYGLHQVHRLLRCRARPQCVWRVREPLGMLFLVILPKHLIDDFLG